MFIGILGKGSASGNLDTRKGLWFGQGSLSGWKLWKMWGLPPNLVLLWVNNPSGRRHKVLHWEFLRCQPHMELALACCTLHPEEKNPEHSNSSNHEKSFRFYRFFTFFSFFFILTLRLGAAGAAGAVQWADTPWICTTAMFVSFSLSSLMLQFLLGWILQGNLILGLGFLFPSLRSRERRNNWRRFSGGLGRPVLAQRFWSVLPMWR